MKRAFRLHLSCCRKFDKTLNKTLEDEKKRIETDVASLFANIKYLKIQFDVQKKELVPDLQDAAQALAQAYVDLGPNKIIDNQSAKKRLDDDLPDII